MKNWTKEICAEKPESLQLVASDTYIERKDITEVFHEETDDMPAYTSYECMSREISVSEYQMLQSITEIQTDKAVSTAIDEYTMQLMEGGIL